MPVATRPKAKNAASRRGNLTIRIRDDLRVAIQARADADHRSLSEEVESRLERSLDREVLLDQVFDLAYRDPHLVGLLLTMGEAMRDALTMLREPNWISDPNAFADVALVAQQSIEAYRPTGTAAPRLGETGAAAIVSYVLLRIFGDTRPIYTAIRERVVDILARLRARQSGISELPAAAPKEINQ